MTENGQGYSLNIDRKRIRTHPLSGTSENTTPLGSIQLVTTHVIYGVSDGFNTPPENGWKLIIQLFWKGKNNTSSQRMQGPRWILLGRVSFWHHRLKLVLGGLILGGRKITDCTSHIESKLQVCSFATKRKTLLILPSHTATSASDVWRPKCVR